MGDLTQLECLVCIYSISGYFLMIQGHTETHTTALTLVGVKPTELTACYLINLQTNSPHSLQLAQIQAFKVSKITGRNTCLILICLVCNDAFKYGFY